MLLKAKTRRFPVVWNRRVSAVWCEGLLNDFEAMMKRDGECKMSVVTDSPSPEKFDRDEYGTVSGLAVLSGGVAVL